MLLLREFWTKHRKKILFTAGVLGSGYLAYKLYHVHKGKLLALERVLAIQRENEELIKAQMRAHFENIQMIADTLTLPHAIQCLSNQMSRELDLSHLTDKLQKAKGHSSTLTTSEKYEMWNRLKILSFTRMVSSMWSATLFGLYTRVQVNILGRHLYLQTARCIEGAPLLEGVDNVDSNEQLRFLSSSDHLAKSGLPIFIRNVQEASTEVLEGKNLADVLTTNDLMQIIMHIMEIPMNIQNQWLILLIPPEDEGCENPPLLGDSGSMDFSNQCIFSQLMAETHAVLLSTEFREILEISLRSVVNSAVEVFEVQFGKSDLASGIRLVTLLPRVAEMCELSLEHPSRNRFVQLLQNLPQVEEFFTVLYSSTPTSAHTA